ncbi:transglycosylase domain-containing protein [Litorivicinus sp.]|nr:transglycosylase domain-containing protein [Litorivicinus sp.]
MNYWIRLALKIFLTLLVLVGMGTVYLNADLTRQFESLSWAVGAKIYARPLELYKNAPFSRSQVLYELDLLNYQRVNIDPSRGQYQLSGKSIIIGTRGHQYPDGKELPRRVSVLFSKERVTEIQVDKGAKLDLIRLEPLMVAKLSGVYPDREIISLNDLPDNFIALLLAVEDRQFYTHNGVSVKGILRALVSNMMVGRFAQGGSTVTQQLVKNLYLSGERTLVRKIVEAGHAILLDLSFSKSKILEAYVNEVFLGQWGSRAIHGFGTASIFYFGRPIRELNEAEQALLIGLIKGPSALNPRRYPGLAIKRRNLVLRLGFEQGVLSESTRLKAVRLPLNIPQMPADRVGRFPGYLDLVQRELTKEYKGQQLNQAGLRIYTALDPQVHRGLLEGREAMIDSLASRGLDPLGQAQLGALVVDLPTGEIQSVIAARDDKSGFNRALDARRQIGSLAKPFVVAAAIEKDSRLNAGTLVRDEAIFIEDELGRVWSPKNYDEGEEGVVRLESLIANSINQATVHLAVSIGLSSILDRMAEYGIPIGPTRPAASVLGVSEMSPYQVASRYQAVLNQGFVTSLKAVRMVVDERDVILTRRPFAPSRLMSGAAAAKVDHMMRVGAKTGTGRVFGQAYPQILASKTGTTDDGRDAWFAGADGRRLGVAWVGFDDNRKAGLTGSLAALPVISRAFFHVQREDRSAELPNELRYGWIDPSGQLVGPDCPGAQKRPVSSENAGLAATQCGEAIRESSDKEGWLKLWFGG